MYKIIHVISSEVRKRWHPKKFFFQKVKKQSKNIFT